MTETKKISITRLIIYTLLTFILVYNITIIFKTLTQPEKTPDFFGFKTYIVTSGSMQPLLKIGDMAISKEVGPNQLEEGDIISFREGKYIVTHRIYSICFENGEITYRTKGDFNNTYDRDTIKYEDIEGKLVFKIPYIGNFSFIMQKPIIIISIIISIYTFIFIKTIRNKKINNKE